MNLDPRARRVIVILLAVIIVLAALLILSIIIPVRPPVTPTSSPIATPVCGPGEVTREPGICVAVTVTATPPKTAIRPTATVTISSPVATP